MSIPCPNNDGGHCATGLPTVAVISEGTVSLLNGPLIEDFIPGGIPYVLEKARLLEGISAKEMREVLVEAALNPAAEVPGQIASQVSPKKRSVVVQCSCGHVFIYEA
ncbi:hypothetical protein [Streptomyces sp. NPDC005890]|uniref:hypothetical protein n=1 Tax=Streptomyces sp. NPDC005890 TaxID=3154568 RepID=UPI0033D01C07